MRAASSRLIISSDAGGCGCSIHAVTPFWVGMPSGSRFQQVPFQYPMIVSPAQRTSTGLPI